jgi:hypothetical protein
MAPSVAWKKRSSTGPPGSHAVTTIGTRVHLAIESRHFGGQRGRRLASLARDVLAFEVAQRAEVALLADRRERVALEMEADDRDSRHSASSIQDC